MEEVVGIGRVVIDVVRRMWGGEWFKWEREEEIRLRRWCDWGRELRCGRRRWGRRDKELWLMLGMEVEENVWVDEGLFEGEGRGEWGVE